MNSRVTDFTIIKESHQKKKLPHFLTSGKEKHFQKVIFSKSKDALGDKGGIVGSLEKTELLASQRSAFQAANSIHSGQCYQCKMKWAKKARRVCQLFL